MRKAIYFLKKASKDLFCYVMLIKFNATIYIAFPIDNGLDSVQRLQICSLYVMATGLIFEDS